MKNKKSLIISSFGVHTGGGLILLNEILKQKKFIKSILLDERVNLSDNLKTVKKIYVKKNYFSRYYHFIKTILNCHKGEVLLCFNNIPPLIKPKCKSILFLQNALYLSNLSFKYSIFKNIKFFFLKVIFKLFVKNVDEIYVQNNFLKKELIQKVKFKKKIKIKRIILLPENIIKNIKNRKKKFLIRKNLKSFFYPASYEIHKNHLNLLNSIKLIKDKKINLYITIKDSEFKNLIKILDLTKEDLKKITNLGQIPFHELKKYYKKSNLIFPSYVESFGLPLYEAYAYGSLIISSNEKFTSNNFKNFIKFNPKKPHSIAKAIKDSFAIKINKNSLKFNKKIIFSATQFINKIIANHVVN